MEMPKRTKVADKSNSASTMNETIHVDPKKFMAARESVEYGPRVREIVLNTAQQLRFKGGGQPKASFSEKEGFEMHLNKSGTLVYIDDKKDDDCISFVGLPNILRGEVYR